MTPFVLPGRTDRQPRLLLLAAHPDDETIGASVVLTGSGDVTMLHVTDGAPHDSQFWPAGVRRRAEYARTRRAELDEALRIAGIPAERRLGFEITDQECALELPRLVERLGRLIETVKPDVLITHAYEGGHPDHDAAAFVAATSTRLLPSAGALAPALWEMALYHGAAGRLATTEFLPSSTRATESLLTVRLSAEQRALKQQMIACFDTQRDLLRQFPLGAERFRLAPRYEFTEAPHAGPLWYEQLGWPLSGARWRELAKGALAELGLPGRLRGDFEGPPERSFDRAAKP